MNYDDYLISIMSIVWHCQHSMKWNDELMKLIRQSDEVMEEVTLGIADMVQMVDDEDNSCCVALVLSYC